MPRAARATASRTIAIEGYEAALADLEGGYTVAFERYSADSDPAELFRGLPDDRCQCPHWGVVLRGRIAFRYADGEEVFSEGDAYYVPPGHTPRVYAGTEIVEFSPTHALDETLVVLGANLAAAGLAG